MSTILAFSSIALSFSASVLLLLALILVAVAVSWWTYRRTVPDITPRRKAVLITLRSLALAVLLFLLFEPVLNLQHSEVLPPRVAVVLDDSRSMTVEDAGVQRAAKLREFIASSSYASLAGEGELKPYLFAGKLFPMQALTPDSLAFNGAETDISRALQGAYDDNVNGNLAAVVLVTDGVYTSGKNPLYAARALGVPVHVLAVGDSTEKKDVLVSRVLANSIAYVESSIPVDATIRSAGYESGRARVTLLEGGNTVGSAAVELRPGVNEYPLSFSWEPRGEGVKKLTLRVESLPGELTAANNSKTMYVKVLKSRMNIVLLAAAPGPDVSLVQRELRKDKNITTTLFVQKAAGAWYDKRPTQEQLAAADCIILIGFPVAQEDMPVLRAVAEAAEKRAVPVMHIPSRATNFTLLKQGLDALLPYDVLKTRSEEVEVFFVPGAEARLNPVMSTGIAAEVWGKLPPLFKTESSFKARAGAQVLGTMSLNSITFNEPLLLQRRVGRGKMIAWTGYGLWRWQLAFDVAQGSVPEMLLSNSIRWLTTRDDDKRVRIRPAREFFDSGENVELLAQVYNESYEPVDNATVTVKVRQAEDERELVLSPQGSGRYIGSLDLGREGDYSYSGVATLDGKELGSDNGRFSVGELNIEFQDTRMNNILLRQIAASTGGSYLTLDEASSLPAIVREHERFAPTERARKEDVQLWNLLWLLGAAIVLFATEWYIRKQAGLV
ncbi:MAG TPA: hypothetical protein PK916_11445 [Bacteroidota bacterium]|nr:hypothetical protein [Bacteroidota bacterium]